jgi:ribonuclease VapC
VIIDSSVLVAIVRDEPGSDKLYKIMRTQAALFVSAANYLESAAVLDGDRIPAVSRRFDGLLRALGLEIASVTASQASIARQAYHDYGRGSGHPARLNYGDCFAYALAIERDEPLLFVGEDFAHTDVRTVELPPTLT